MQLASPVAPLVSSGRSEGTITGESWWSCAAENVWRVEGRQPIPQDPSGIGARVTATGGALPASGVGRNGA